MDQEQTFFDFAAEVGLTKHIGSVTATDELVALCHISEGQRVLDVGCGVGMTPCYLAKKYGCQVSGVDIRQGMIERSKERARKEGVTDQVAFWVADAQALPFEDELFDAVITESVTAFPEDKERALEEYVRVTKPGGCVGLNESTWLKVPVPAEVVAWASQDVGANVQPLTSEEWQELLEQAGLQEIVVKIRTVDARDEAKGIVRRYGYGGMLGTSIKALRLYIRNPAYRRFVKGVRKQGIIPKDLDQYFGYGLFVGRKQGRLGQHLTNQRATARLVELSANAPISLA